ncbi:MAG: lipid-binding SYLF domain-containing protein [Deltaproteobacteria bacterium]
MKRIVGLAMILMSAGLVVSPDSMALSLGELDRRILACNQVLKSVLQMPDRGIPKDLFQRCRGLAVFPGVVKAGVVIGVSYGNGVILRRDENTGEWTRPVFFTIRGASIGFQAGAQFTDLILLVMSEQGVQGLLEDQLILGADVAVAVGPVGRQAAAETDMRLNTGILSYSRSKGLFAGVSLAGAVLAPDIAANEMYHGKGVTVQDVFYENQGALSEGARTLFQTLEEATQQGESG